MTDDEQIQWEAILKLWENPSCGSGKTWTVFVNRYAGLQEYEEHLNHYAQKRGIDPQNLEVREAFRLKNKRLFDRFGVASQYFKAKVREVGLAEVRRYDLMNSERITLAELLQELDKLTPEKAFKDQHTIANLEFTKEAPISKLDFSKLGIGRKFPIVVVNVQEMYGIDGTTYGVIMQNFSATLQLQWWADGPKEWRKITQWAAETRALLSSIITEYHGDRLR